MAHIETHEGGEVAVYPTFPRGMTVLTLDYGDDAVLLRLTPSEALAVAHALIGAATGIVKPDVAVAEAA